MKSRPCDSLSTPPTTMINPPRRQTRSKVRARPSSRLPHLRQASRPTSNRAASRRFFSSVSLVAGCLWIVDRPVVPPHGGHQLARDDPDRGGDVGRRCQQPVCAQIVWHVHAHRLLRRRAQLRPRHHPPAERARLRASMAIAPAITFITIFVGLLKADIVFGWPAPYGGPTGLRRSTGRRRRCRRLRSASARSSSSTCSTSSSPAACSPTAARRGRAEAAEDGLLLLLPADRRHAARAVAHAAQRLAARLAWLPRRPLNSDGRPPV